MLIESILPPERTLLGVPGGSKKRVLEFISRFIAQNVPSLDSNEVFDRLIAREKLGSTGIGHGVAIPHCRISHCSQALGVFLRLDDAVDFDAVDGQPVDLVFALLVPEEATQKHLEILAALAELFSQESFRTRLRNAEDQQALYDALVQQPDTVLTNNGG